MRHKLTYKKHRNSKWKFTQFARSGQLVEGSNPEGHNWILEVENGEVYTGKYLDDCKEQWHREISKEYWTSGFAKSIEQVFN